MLLIVARKISSAVGCLAACLKHFVGSRNHPEQPARVAAVMSSLRELLDEQYSGEAETQYVFNLQEMESSPAMLKMLEAQLSELTAEPGASPSKMLGLQRTDSCLLYTSPSPRDS